MGITERLFHLSSEEVNELKRRHRFDALAFGIGLALFILPFALLWAGQTFRGHPTYAEWQGHGGNHGPWVDCWGRHFIGIPLAVYLMLLVVAYAFYFPIEAAVAKREQHGCGVPVFILGSNALFLAVQLLMLMWLVD